MTLRVRTLSLQASIILLVPVPDVSKSFSLKNTFYGFLPHYYYQQLPHVPFRKSGLSIKLT